MKCSDNKLLDGLRGMMGKKMVYRQLRGETIAQHPPQKSLKPTAHQEKTKDRMLRAVHYAKRQMKDPVSNAIYTTGITRDKFSVYLVALTDFLKAPEITSIETEAWQQGGGIMIVAKDDFRVESVKVKICDEQGAVVEEGDGVQVSGEVWSYEPRVAWGAWRRVCVEVRDRAGNVTVGEMC